MGANFREESLATTGAMLFVPQGTRHAGTPQTRQRSVLICDPSRALCRTIAQIVNGLGVQAVAATDGSAAIRLGAMHAPDLVLHAENMPGLRAMDFLDAGLGHLLNRRALLVDRRARGLPRWLPVIKTPLEISRCQREIVELLHSMDQSG